MEVVGDTVRFTHPLLAAATYGRATLERRREVHERLAQVVTEPEGQQGTWRGRRSGRTSPSPGRSRTARRRPSAGAPEVAAELAEEAARLTPTDATDDRHRRLMIAAEHLAVSGDIEPRDELLAGITAECRTGRCAPTS